MVLLGLIHLGVVAEDRRRVGRIAFAADDRDKPEGLLIVQVVVLLADGELVALDLVDVRGVLLAGLRVDRAVLLEMLTPLEVLGATTRLDLKDNCVQRLEGRRRQLGLHVGGGVHGGRLVGWLRCLRLLARLLVRLLDLALLIGVRLGLLDAKRARAAEVARHGCAVLV